MKIAVAGPGRSGTSLLVRLFGSWGFEIPSGHWFENAEAGLESRIGTGSSFEVDKDPWAFEYLDRIDSDLLQQYEALIVPIRNREDAAVSRSVQESYARVRTHHVDHWRWKTVGSMPGGAIADISVEAVSRTLDNGLWDLIEKAAFLGLNPRFLHFPRFASDFDYLWSQVGDLVMPRMSETDARTAWIQTVDSRKVRITKTTHDRRSAELRELEGVIELLRRDVQRLSDELVERDALYATAMASERASTSAAIEGEARMRAERDSAFADKALHVGAVARLIELDESFVSLVATLSQCETEVQALREMEVRLGAELEMLSMRCADLQSTEVSLTVRLANANQHEGQLEEAVRLFLSQAKLHEARAERITSSRSYRVSRVLSTPFRSLRRMRESK